MKSGLQRGLVWLLLMAPVLVQAEIKQVSAESMLIEQRFQLSAAPQEAWAVLIHPERYWPADHTWSGAAGNLSLQAQAGGCFCENWEQGSAEHARVVMAQPGALLRLQGALGPFQDMAVTGVLSIALSATADGSEAVVTYRISGDASHQLEQLAPVVDAVVAQQFSGFARLAGSK